MKISYNWLKSYVPEVPEPNKLADIFTYHLCEVESVEKLANGDHLFDLGILPNRAHDLLSHQGVARELASLLRIKFKDPSPMYKTPASHPTNLKINIASDKCRRYSGRIVRGVKVGPSPAWMVEHLESIGQRSINNIVDATNIVMYDYGEPMHAFDLSKITDNTLTIEFAKEGDELALVGRSQNVVKLLNTDLMITSGGTNLAIAGVKGGLDSGVSDNTNDILIEVANFDPTSVRKTARRIGELTDSAKRFENDLSPTACDFAMFAISALLLEIFPDAAFEDVVDVYPHKQEEKNVKFTKSYIEKTLGIEIKDEILEKILQNYNYKWKHDGDEYEVTVPSLRLDLNSREDMAEEVARIIGYDQIKPLLSSQKHESKVNDTTAKIQKIKQYFVSIGYREVMTYTFASSGDVEVLASASDKKFMRTNISGGLKDSYELNKLNLPILGDKEVKIFEIGTIFTKNGPASPHDNSSGAGWEEVHVAWNEKDKIIEKELNDYYASLNSSAEILSGRSSDLLSDLSSAGQTIPENISTPDQPEIFKMWSLYPFVTRDIAVWVPENTSADALSDIYQEFGTELLQGEPKLVDTFTKEGRTSYAFRLLFQSFDRTLTTEEVNLIMSKITEKITSLGWEVR